VSESFEPDIDAIQARTDLIAAALSKLQADLPTVAREQTGEIKGTTKDGTRYSYEYTYANLASVTKLLYPRLGELGLSFTAAPSINDRGQFVLRYALLHASGQSIRGEYPLPTDVKSPQAMGSAITYARRYCLCSVTGVVTDDDDGAAAEHAARDQAMQPSDPERSAAVAQVGAAWVAQYGARPDGSPDWDAIGREFGKWSNGKRSQDVPAATLRAFAGYLSALPAADAGSDPADQPAADPAADMPGPRSPAPELTERTRKMLFALWNERGFKLRQDQLAYARSVLGREVESRSDLTEQDAQALISVLKSDGDH
jgi:hypothetical protein